MYKMGKLEVTEFFLKKIKTFKTARNSRSLIMFCFMEEYNSGSTEIKRPTTYLFILRE